MGAKNEVKLRKKRVLSRKAAKQFREQAIKIFGEINAKTIAMGEVEDGTKVYLLDGEASFALASDTMYPALNNPHIEKLPNVVVIRDVNHGKALAIASALVSSENFKDMTKGKAFRNLHYVGDKIWNAIN